MKSKIWRKNFEVMRSDYQLFIETSESFYVYQIPTVGRYFIKESIFVFENGDNTAALFVIDELRKLIENTLQAIITNPDKIRSVHRKAIAYNEQLFEEARRVEKMDLSKLKDKQLVRLYKKFYRLIQLGHGYSLPTTWFVDSDGEDLSNYSINFIKDKIKKAKIKISAPEAFSILTTPEKESYSQKEEKEMYKILNLIRKDNQARILFKKEDVVEIKNGLSKIDKKLNNKIINHYKNWRWMPYTYRGPAYDLDNYLGIWSSLVRQNIDPKEALRQMVDLHKNSQTKRIKLIKDLKLTEKEIKIFDVAAEIVWLKGFRKDVSFRGYYVNDMILKELGKRAGLSLMQMKYSSVHDIDNFKNFSADELNARYKFSIIYAQKGKPKILAGEKAKAFLKKQKLEKVELKNVEELKGTCAFVGKVSGIVKIVNYPEEMGKMEKGNIMVAHTTFPSLVPAMKKAAAIVTDDGGITCHAAIVARELKKPCVVGTKIATQVLKDGDRVEVDAEKGIVKKIK